MMDIQIYIGISFLIFLYYKLVTSNKLHNIPFVPNFIPFVGQTFKIQNHPRTFLKQCQDKFGEVYTISYLGKRVVILAGKEAIKMSKTVGLNMLEARNEVTLILDALGNFKESKGRPNDAIETHLTVKKFLGPLTNSVFPTSLIKLDETIKNLPSQTISLSKLCYNIIGETISTLLMGEELAKDKEIKKIMVEFAMNVESRCKRYQNFTLIPIIGYDLAQYFIRSTDPTPKARSYFLKKIEIVSKEKELKPTCFLNAMLMEGYSNEVITEELISLTFASLFTTMSSSQRLIEDLLSFPEYFKGLRHEIHSVLPNPSEPITIDQLNQLEFMDSSIRESLRHRSQAPELWRKTKSPVTLTNGLVIPKDTYIALDIPSIQFSPNNYGTSPLRKDTNPQEYALQFDPFRFVHTNCKAPKLTNDFYSFGAGKHACPGRFFAVQMITAFLATLLKYHRIHTIDDEPLPFKNSDTIGNVTIKLVPI